MTRPKPLVLIILDGWGYRAETKANAIALARKPTYDRLLREYPNTLIHTSGPYVGLPDGQMGNSEVGNVSRPSMKAWMKTRSTPFCLAMRSSA